ncbi:pseudouridine synthase [Shewanella waksmanii]|uniref:pseudouridine synthase n=1 Tax=Shewanella waksmanii TaxID=213783 RepID=UPI003736C9CC
MSVEVSPVNAPATPLIERSHHHYKIFKPYGFLSQFVPETRKRKKLLGELAEFPIGTMAIGRLDHDSEGLLLLTTDGMVSHQVRSKKVEKEYYVEVDGDINDEAILKLQQGVEIGIKGEKYLTLPCQVFKLNCEPDLPSNGRKRRDPRHGPMSWISITISEGKNRQIRKMTAAAGFPTMRLVRVRIGNITLDKMQPAEVIEVSNIPRAMGVISSANDWG